jgi:NADH dehydrogenase
VVNNTDGAPTPAPTLVWASGVTPAPLVSKTDLPTTGRGWITVNADMSVPGFPGIWALGDCAQIPNPLEPGKFQPALAQHAIREAQQLARNIVASMRGQPAQPFLYKSLGQMAMLGHHDGIAMVGRFKARGYLAWALWRAYYLWRLPRTVKKARVTLDWIFEDLFGRDITEIRTDTRRSLAERTERARSTAGTGQG